MLQKDEGELFSHKAMRKIFLMMIYWTCLPISIFTKKKHTRALRQQNLNSCGSTLKTEISSNLNTSQ